LRDILEPLREGECRKYLISDEANGELTRLQCCCPWPWSLALALKVKSLLTTLLGCEGRELNLQVKVGITSDVQNFWTLIGYIVNGLAVSGGIHMLGCQSITINA